MIRNRLVSTLLLALATSAAVILAAEPPLALPDAQPPTPTEQPPGHIIKVDIGFEPGPLEDSAESPAVPEPPAAPPASSPIRPASAAPVMPPAATSSVSIIPAVGTSAETARQAPISLGMFERLAMNRIAKRAQSMSGAIQQCSCTEPKNPEIADMPTGFVDHAVTAMIGMPSKSVSAMTAAQAQLVGQEYRAINYVRLHYYHLLALQKLIAVREDLAGVSRDAVTAIEAMTAAGQATKAELLQARIDAREQAAAFEAARATYQAVWTRLAAAIGLPELPVGSLAGDVEQSCMTPTFDAAWAHLLAASPELQAVRGEVARRQAGLRQSLSGSSDKPIEAEKANSDGIVSQAAAFFGSPAPLHDPRVKQAAWTELSRWEGEVGRTEQSLKNRLTAAFAACDRAKEMAELYRTQNLPDAKEVFELSVIGYRQGRCSWPQVQLAQKNYFRMSTEYVEALAELRRAELTILGLVMDIPDPTTGAK
jgi:hypothetical protein